jgi:hypothetical protein
VCPDFPRWQESGNGGFRDVAEVHGLIRALEGVESQRLVLRDPVLGGVAADGGPTWAGFSGAAVFHGGLLLGVVIEHHARQGDTALQIRPVEAIAEADDSAARRLAEPLGSGRDGALRPVATCSWIVNASPGPLLSSWSRLAVPASFRRHPAARNASYGGGPALWGRRGLRPGARESADEWCCITTWLLGKQTSAEQPVRVLWRHAFNDRIAV